MGSSYYYLLAVLFAGCITFFCIAPVSSFRSFQPLPTKRFRNVPWNARDADRISQVVIFSSSNSNEHDENFPAPIDCLKEAMKRIYILQQGTSLLRKQPVRVGPSSIPGAGSGVFATKNIKAGTIISLYPVHGMGLERFDTNAIVAATEEDHAYFHPLDDDENKGDDDDGEEGGLGDEEVDDDAENVARNHNYLHYLIGSRPLCGFRPADHDATLYIDVNPNKIVQEPWISHLINDGAIVESNTEQGLLDYYRETTKRKNCVHIPFGPAPLMVTVTNCKVKKGEELFTTYGGSYWLDAFLEYDDEEPVDITEAVHLQAKQTAQDLFSSMQNARTTYVNLEADLEKEFSMSLLE